jgi:hypothetical protein
MELLGAAPHALPAGSDGRDAMTDGNLKLATTLHVSEQLSAQADSVLTEGRPPARRETRITRDSRFGHPAAEIMH